ncbi:MAG: hemerythrin domain-containing protein [Pseudomonadota bacterium]
MKNDSKEISAVSATAGAAAATTGAAPRFDMYGGIHKALRALMADTLLAVGRMDADDALERAQTCQRVLQLLDACASHLKHENEFIHTAMEARAPGASERIAHEHEEHVQHINALGAKVAALMDSAEAGRAAAATDLYRSLSLFIAENYQHMHVEETAHNAVLQARYTDAELIAIHDALVASIPPQEMMTTLRWLVPFANPAERAAMLGDIRSKAPAQVFDAIIDTVRPHLSDNEWVKLARALQLPVAAGLVELW